MNEGFTNLSIKENSCVVNWQVERILFPQNEKQIIDGAFVFSLNNENLCNYFKQWRTVETI
ncbi:MAG: hypothetical protein WC523_03190 [Patescibacteria group bacterium]|jgi:hypothetical protein